MKRFLKIFLLLVVLVNTTAFAQEKIEKAKDSLTESSVKATAAEVPAVPGTSNNVEMAGVMRSNGKIYIVVAVCLTILTGLFVYVRSVERKISQVEKEA